MRRITLLGATIAATMAFSHVASADYVPRIACLPTVNISEGPYWVDCGSQPGGNCSCKEGFAAFNPLKIESGNTTASGGRPQPISASPG